MLMYMLLSMHRKPTDIVENKKRLKRRVNRWDAAELIIQIQVQKIY